MNKQPIDARRGKVTATKTRLNRKVFGGNINYDSFGEFIDGRTHGALERLVNIIHWEFGMSLADWPLAFKTVQQAEQFLDELLHEDACWLRMTDGMVEVIGANHTNGPWGDEDCPMATFADAARELREVKEEYFDTGKEFGY